MNDSFKHGLMVHGWARMSPLKEATNFTNEHEFFFGDFAPSRLGATFFSVESRMAWIFTPVAFIRGYT